MAGEVIRVPYPLSALGEERLERVASSRSLKQTSLTNRLDHALGGGNLRLIRNRLDRSRLCRRPIRVCGGRDVPVGKLQAEPCTGPDASCGVHGPTLLIAHHG